MSIILGLDTSTDACSVALNHDGIIHEDYRVLPREHTRHLLPMVDGLLSQCGLALSEIDGIAFTRGPGSFTGLRVCIGMVQGLAFGADLPVIPVSSLEVLAQTAVDQEVAVPGQTILATIDARMDEIYWAVHQVEPDASLWRVQEDTLSAPEKLTLLPEQCQDLIGVGTGLVYGERLPLFSSCHYRDDALLPRASALVRLAAHVFDQGRAVAAEEAIPVYLRDEVAWK